MRIFITLYLLSYSPETSKILANVLSEITNKRIYKTLLIMPQDVNSSKMIDTFWEILTISKLKIICVVYIQTTRTSRKTKSGSIRKANRRVLSEEIITAP
jgi:hypothetical protein